MTKKIIPTGEVAIWVYRILEEKIAKYRRADCQRYRNEISPHAFNFVTDVAINISQKYLNISLAISSPNNFIM